MRILLSKHDTNPCNNNNTGRRYSENPLVGDRDEADPRFPTLRQMRTELSRVVELLRSRGDDSLHYLSGLELFNESDMEARLAPDNLHPNGDGYVVAYRTNLLCAIIFIPSLCFLMLALLSRHYVS